MIGLPKAQAELAWFSSNPDALAGVDAQRVAAFKRLMGKHWSIYEKQRKPTK